MTEYRCFDATIPYVIAIGVCAPAETHGAVAVEELLEERAAGEPHPAACIHTPVCIQQQLLKHLNTQSETVGHILIKYSVPIVFSIN